MNFQISARADGRKAWRGRLGRVEICRNQTLIDITVWQFDADIQRIRSRLRIAAVTIVLSVRISQQRVGRAPPGGDRDKLPVARDRFPKSSQSAGGAVYAAVVTRSVAAAELVRAAAARAGRVRNCPHRGAGCARDRRDVILFMLRLPRGERTDDTGFRSGQAHSRRVHARARDTPCGVDARASCAVRRAPWPRRARLSSAACVRADPAALDPPRPSTPAVSPHSLCTRASSRGGNRSTGSIVRHRRQLSRRPHGRSSRLLAY